MQSYSGRREFSHRWRRLIGIGKRRGCADGWYGVDFDAVVGRNKKAGRTRSL